MHRPGFPSIDRVVCESVQRRRDGESQSWMFVAHDVLLVLVDDGVASLANVEAQKGKELVVKRHRHAHIANGDLDVVDHRFHERVSASDSVSCYYAAGNETGTGPLTNQPRRQGDERDDGGADGQAAFALAPLEGLFRGHTCPDYRHFTPWVFRAEGGGRYDQVPETEGE